MANFTIQLPAVKLEQGEEYFTLIRSDGRVEHVDCQDYDTIYSIPGLYEELFLRRLRCESPRVAAQMLMQTAIKEGIDLLSLRVLDLGAGTGHVAKELYELGLKFIVGVDIRHTAYVAAKRDREPWPYVDYLVCDVSTLESEKALQALSINALVCIAAIGAAGLPAYVLKAGLSLLPSQGLVMIDVRDKLWDNPPPGSSAEVLRRSLDSGEFTLLELITREHRKSVSGESLVYKMLVARKR